MTAEYALFGHPVAHSRSPAIHEAFARQTGQDLHYRLIDCPDDDFEQRARDFFADGGAGANVTLPFKARALALADEAGEAAQAAGAANTLVHLPGGRLRAENTDGAGLVADLVDNLGFNPAGKRILLVGAGGAAAGAIGPLLATRPAELLVANRTPGRARQLVARFAGEPALHASGLDIDGPAFELVINATSASLSGTVPEVTDSVVGPRTLCYDMFYADTPTAFLVWADLRGAGRTADGWGMMVEQAAESFRLWRGVRPDTRSLLRTRPAAG
ncbi:MAG: shikimate dehydrogenase [Gammaproteobacteria bacterium]|jgi:shikimate dehydrogenase